MVCEIEDHRNLHVTESVLSLCVCVHEKREREMHMCVCV